MDQRVQLVEAHDYLDKIIATLQTMERREKGPLVATLEHLSNFIRSTRSEICSLRPDDAQGDFLSSANDELEQIVSETAKATNSIMEAAESLEKIATDVPREAGSQLIDVATQIYEACAFQDITGQRITKVIRALQNIETKVHALAQACEAEIPKGRGGAAAAIPPAQGDAALLNGPQLPTSAKSQAEIDQLFNDGAWTAA